jgi:uncharacterized membrane protein YeaQ/YmgE (transglycosylase-associated protein family)
MDLIFWIIVGIVAGALAKTVVPVEGPDVTLGDLVAGVIGAVLGGSLFRLGLGSSYGGWIGSTLVALVGAVVVLWLLRIVVRQHPAA